MSEGRLDYTIRLDTDQLQRDAESSKKAFEDIGKSASDVGSTIDRSFNDKNFGGLYDMRESIKASQEYLVQLKDKYNEVSNAMRNAPLGSDTSQLEADLQAVKTEIDEEEAALAGLQARYDTISSQSVPSIRTQMRELQQTMMQLRLEGNQNTDTYRQLEQQLSRLATVQRQVNQERKMGSSGATDIAAWLQGVQGLAGAYTAASGAMSLFVKDQEKLMAIQTKLQSLMSILIGLQQVSNTLHSTSAFRLRALTTVQTAYNTVVGKTSTALQAFGVSAKAADTAAKALTATLTLGLSVAITAVVALLNKLSSEEDKAIEKAKEQIKVEENARKTMMETRIEMESYIERLQNKNMSETEAAQLVDELNQKYSDSLGYYSNINDWLVVLTKNGELYIDMLYRQALAQAYVQKAVDAETTRAEKEAAQGVESTWHKVWTTALEVVNYPFAKYVEKSLADEVKEEIAAAEQETEDYKNRAQENLKEAANIRTQLSEGAGTRPETATSTPSRGRTTYAKSESDETKKELEELGKLQNQLIEDNQKRALDLYEDGYQKRMAQLDFQREQELKRLQEQQDKIAKQNKKAGITNEEVLTEQQSEEFARARMLIDENYYNNQHALLEQNLQDLLTYEQQREKILKEYAAREEALYEHDEQGNRTGLREGVTQGNVENLHELRDADMKTLDSTLLSKQEWYEDWCTSITNMSLQQLEELMESLKKSLEEMEAAGADAESIGVLRGQITAINDQIGKMKTSPSKNSDTEWQKLYKTLNMCEKEFESLGDTIGGTAGEIIKTAGQVASSTLSMINSIQQLVKGSSKAMEQTAEGAKDSINAVEQASVLLTAMSAALSIGTAIANLFNSDNKKQKQIENLQQQIDQLQWELDNTAAVRIQNQLGDALTVVRDIYAQTVKEIERMHSANSSYADSATKSMTRVQKETEAYNKSIQKIADTYANLEYTTTHVLGTEQYSNAREELENYAQQLMLIQEQYDLENKKKKTDTEQLQEYQQQMDEIAEKMATLVDELVEDIIGGSAADIAQQLGDAFVEAFQAGEDAAQAWGDTVDDIVSNIIKNMLITEILEPQIGKIFDAYEDMWYKNGEFQGTEAVIASMSSFADELNAVQNDFAAVWDALSEEMLDYFTTDSERTGVNQGIASASQESVDELNGRATAIQSHTYSINETTKSMLVTSNLILQSIVNIEGNTDGLSTRMATVESYVKEMRDTTNDMYRLGVKIR